jgi:hypothetical protein
MNMEKKTSGRPHRVSRVRKEETSPPEQTTPEQKTPLPVKHRNTSKTVPEPEMTNIEVIFHHQYDLTEAGARPGWTRANPIVYEAMAILRKCGFQPARMSEPLIPINLIGLKKSGSVLVFAFRSHVAVPSAAKLRELYTGKVDCLRKLAKNVLDKIMIRVYSPACGWRYYLIYPGGLRYDHDFPASLN